VSAPAKKPTAAELSAAQWAESKRARELEQQQHRDEVIGEFSGDARAMAAEILRYRHAIEQLADAVSWIKDGRPFVAMPPGPYRNDRKLGTS
jgi:hypothetical protein